jgi:Secretion system C-terminal sorting domain
MPQKKFGAFLINIDENKALANSLKLFPNPVTSILHFNLENETSVSIVITDVLGKVVLSETTQTNSILIENLTSGIYFLTVKTQSGAVAKVKFIKE